MKASKYNIIVSLGNNNFLVFNTLTQSMALVDQEVKDILGSDKISLPPECQKHLSQIGAIIEDHVHEEDILKCNLERAKYDSQTITFTAVVTYACNLACPYCYEGKGEISRESMSEERIESVAQFIQRETEKDRSKTVNLVLYGGEPLLNSKGCFRLLDRLTSWTRTKDITLTTHLDTNGTLLTGNIVRKFSEYDNVHVRTALHGPKEVHDRIRIFKNGKGTFDKIMNALELLKTSSIPTSLCVNVDKESVNEMGALLDDLKERGFSHIPIRFSFVSAVTAMCRHYSHVCIDEKERVTNMYELWSLGKEKGFEVIKPGYRGIFCAASVRNHYIIDPRLDVYKCADLVGQRDHRAGVISKQGEFNPEFTWYDILARDPASIEECINCALLPLCKAGCMNIGFLKYGTYHAPGCYDKESMITSMKIHIQERFSYLAK